VDNDPEYRNTVKEALEEVGYEVISVPGAEEALEKANDRKLRFNMALVDMRLRDDDDIHDHSGLKLLHELPANLPVVFLSAHEDAQVIRMAYESAPGQREPDAYLFKGDGLNAIRQCVQKVSTGTLQESRPWYKERGFYYLATITIVVMLIAGFYIEFISEGTQILGVIVVGVVIEILAGLLVNFFKIGQK
jgi:CheY-like chemotaxis protein